MSESNGVQKKLTLEDLERFLESPTEATEAQTVSSKAKMNLTPYLDAAAVLVAFDPLRLLSRHNGSDTSSREALLKQLILLSEPFTENPLRGLWTLPFPERRAALRRLATRENMRQALNANPNRPNTSVQHMFERLVDGKTISVDKLSRDELVSLITVLDWVEDILDGLPEKTAVRLAIAKVDLLAPMQRLAGRGFVDRQQEIKQIIAYVFGESSWPHPPLFLFGPGGVGKSSLIGYFILKYVKPKNLPFVYIDIDRPTVQPDSPSTLLIEIISQLQSQLGLSMQVIDPIIKGLVSSPLRREDQRYVESVSAGGDLSRHLGLLKKVLEHVTPPPSHIVFFIDTFEEVQFLGPSVVWKVIDFLVMLAESDPSFRVLISGRALPEEFIYRGLKDSPKNFIDKWSWKELLIEKIPLPWRPINLGMLDKDAARTLLQNAIRFEGLSPLSADDLDVIIDIVGQNPMCLKLAARLLRDEGVEKFQETRSQFLTKLKAEKIQALLYGRILHHVHGDDIRKIAYPGLIVRRITPDVIRDVLAEPCRLKLNEQRNESDIFNDLAKEAALVEIDHIDNSLRHRVDVRRVMLEDMTDHVEPEVIKAIDLAAVKFYEAQTGDIQRAEEIYHRLRLCQPIHILDERWSSEAAIRLKDASEELKAEQRLWLAEKLGIALDEAVRQTASQEAWEGQAARTADQFLQSGAAEQALSVLRERSARLPRSPLYSLEAEALRFLGNFDEALRVARSGVNAVSKAGAIDMTLDLLLKMVIIEETRSRLDQAAKLLDEAKDVAAYSHNEILRLRVKITELRIQRQLRPEAREERFKMRREVLPVLTDEMLYKLRSHPVLLREVAAELGKEDARIAKAAIKTLGVEVATDAQAQAFGRAVNTLNAAQSSEDADPSMTKITEQIQKTDFDPNIVRRWVEEELTTAETKKIGRSLESAEPRSKELDDFREYFRAGVKSTMTFSGGKR